MVKKGKKSFFKRQTLGKIKEKYDAKEVGNLNIVKNLLSLKNNEFLLIKEDLISKSYPNPKDFLKKAQRLEVGNIEVMAQKGITPLKARERALDNLKYSMYGGLIYTSDNFFVPNLEISLVDCLEGSKLYCYSNRNIKGCCNPVIYIKSYADASSEAGAAFIVSTPSRTRGRGKYKFKYDNIPIIDNNMKFNLGMIANTNHSCEEKNYDIRRSSKLKKYLRYAKFCPHEIASYLQIIEYCNKNENSRIPLEMSLFAIPTQLTADIYTLASNKTLIEDKGKQRLLEKGELERILWLAVKDYGNKDTFYATKKLKSYNWNVDKI